ncbi:MAG: nucleotidyltransferase domain-containing protein [Candidatus Rokuibacteriota bacterium]
MVSAYLFGSHAERRAHRESGVAVLLSRDIRASPRARFEERVRLSTWLVGELQTNLVDVVVLNESPPGLARRIVTTGRRVFSGDPAADHTFVRDVQLRAADLEPFLRRTRRLKLAALFR